MFDLIIIGGGPAGVFAAITYKRLYPDSSILVLEKSQALLSKILISGGGRCNLTNASSDPSSLVKNYPRGEKELLGPFNRFGPKDIMKFFEDRNVKLKIEKDGRVFPLSNSAHTIRDCLLNEMKTLGIETKLDQKIINLIKKEDGFLVETNNKTYLSKKLILSSGSSIEGYKCAKNLGHRIEKPLPSLFAFKITPSLEELSGISLPFVTVKIKGSSFSQSGPLLFTHFGLSGPAILKLSSFGAKHLHEKDTHLEINWIAISEEEAFSKLSNCKKQNPEKTLLSQNIFTLPQRVWRKFLDESDDLKKNLKDISLKTLRKFAEKLTRDAYEFCGKSPHKNEFVTCGGVVLNEINFKTMESKICPNLYFAGEILDIDGLTGGFNFQNAWTTGFIAGSM